MDTLQITMFGELSLQLGDTRISERDNRTRKIWLLLSYLLCHRWRSVTQKELIELLWGDDPASSNPENALRITFHRLRSQLDKLYDGAGHDLILYKDAGYAWNNDIPVVIDAERFDVLLKETKDRETLLAAISLYQGEFLEKQSAETWVIPVATHHHNLYITAVLDLVPRLAEEGLYIQAAAICRNAIAREPYDERLYQALMEQYGAMGNTSAAAAAYEELSRKLFDDFGIRPGEETRAVYRRTAHSVSDRTLDIDIVLEHLQEPDAQAGAMQCDYDYFKVLCYAESRAMLRSGKATHIVLLSVSAPQDTVSKRSLERGMTQLGEQIRLNLRRGDAFSRCSVSQYIIMLPGANYENSCMVSRRVIGAFTRRHPQSPLTIHFIVQPLSGELPVS